MKRNQLNPYKLNYAKPRCTGHDDKAALKALQKSLGHKTSEEPKSAIRDEHKLK
jgi:hypothetical protein